MLNVRNCIVLLYWQLTVLLAHVMLLRSAVLYDMKYSSAVATCLTTDE